MWRSRLEIITSLILVQQEPLQPHSFITALRIVYQSLLLLFVVDKKKTAAYYCESIKSGGGESPTRIHFSSFGEEDLHKSCVSQQSFFFLLGCVNTVCGPVAPTRSCSPTGREAEHKMCHSSEKQHVNSLCCQKPLKETQLWNLEWLEFAQWKAGVDQHFIWPGANCGGFIFITKWRLNGV